MKTLRRDRMRYVSGLPIVAGGVTYICIKVWQVVVSFVYQATENCHYDKELAQLLGKAYKPAEAIHACKVSALKGAELEGWLCVIVVVLGATALLARVVDYVAFEAWGPGSERYWRLSFRVMPVCIWSCIGMTVIGGWAVMRLRPLF